MARGRHGVVGLVCVLAALVFAAGAAAFGGLPPEGRVNNDPGAGILPTLSVGKEDPTNADVVGGALTAGKPAVPWAIFNQEEELLEDQIFVRSFAGGAWTTRGIGTVGGRSSAGPFFSGSLNFDQEQEGEAPAIDFAGTARTVPWATWYEATAGAGFGFETNIFASRFDNTGDVNQNKWIFAGQGRGTGGVSAVPVPSLNIHTNQEAENPSVAGGSAVDPTKPGPWITWQETTESPTPGAPQIFTVRPIGPGAANCDGVKPEGVAEGGHVPAIGGFCWQQVGVPRVGPGGADPSLNVDPTREGVEPDIAFTGASDGVPWVVWYEEGLTELEGPLAEPLHENEMVFAAKAVKDGEAKNGEFHWVAVGTHGSGTLDTSGANKFGSCAESASNEADCSLNSNPARDAEDPRVAAGTMNSANPTVPWVAWDEETPAKTKQVFVSRLVGGTHFEIVNGGAPISTGPGNATRPDITFSGNIPYVSWRQEVEPGVARGFYGHFVNPSSPTFVLDESNVPLTPTAQADVREPISSGCIATPFNLDGASCQGGAVGTPFFLFTNGLSPRGLFADAYQPEPPVTGTSSSVEANTATVSGAVNPAGAATNVFFEFGTTPSYGQTTPLQRIEAADSVVPFAASLSGLPAGTTIHYRAVARTDFGSFPGVDQTLTTRPPVNKPPPPQKAVATLGRASVSGKSASVRVSCSGSVGTCTVTAKLTVTELLRHGKLVGLTARSKPKRKVVVVGSAKVTLNPGETRVLKIALNATGKHLLARRHKLEVRLRVSGAGNAPSQLLTFKLPKHH
jgi:hypothetical protein